MRCFFPASKCAVSCPCVLLFLGVIACVTASFAASSSSVPELQLSTKDLSFGSVNLNVASAPQSVTLTSSGTAPLTIRTVTLAGSEFSMSGPALPVTLNPGQTATFTVIFDPTVTGRSTGSIKIVDNASSRTKTITLSGSGEAATGVLSGLTCSQALITGSGSDLCTVTLNAAAGSGGQVVSLSSSVTAVTVPSSVTVAAGATTASFTATVSAVSTAETATLTASSGGGTQTYTISLGAAVPMLTLSTATVSFGTVGVGASTSQAVTLTSSGTAPLVLSAGTVTGTSFTISGVSFPLTLNPGQTATLTVGFAPTAGGAVSGSVTLTSNSSTGSSTSITLSGTGQPVLSGLSCSNGSMTGAGTDTCTVTLNATAGTGGQAVSLLSSVTAVTVLSSVTVAAGATTASFTATISAVSTAETATLTASSGGGTQTYTISLGSGGPTLTLQSTNVLFGDVTLSNPAYQTVTLTSSGSTPVTLSAGSVSGTGYTISGVSFPSTLNPGTTATLEIEFDPTTAGVSNGTVTLTSNSSTNTTATISLSGTGVAASYEVDLTWDAPVASSDPVEGYNIYRAVSGSSTYELLNSSTEASTTYTDTTVANNTSYIYYVESVDASGNQSAPSNVFSVTIP